MQHLLAVSGNAAYLDLLVYVCVVENFALYRIFRKNGRKFRFVYGGEEVDYKWKLEKIVSRLMVMPSFKNIGGENGDFRSIKATVSGTI